MHGELGQIISRVNIIIRNQQPLFCDPLRSRWRISKKTEPRKAEEPVVNHRLAVLISLVALAALLPAPAAVADELLPPVRLQADGQPIDVQHYGHAAPCVGDFDGDGVNDLMVGEAYEGRMRIFRTAGSNGRF